MWCLPVPHQNNNNNYYLISICKEMNKFLVTWLREKEQDAAYEAWTPFSMEWPFLWTKFWMVCDSFPSLRIVTFKRRDVCLSYFSNWDCINVMLLITLWMVLHISCPASRMVFFNLLVLCKELWFCLRTKPVATLELKSTYTILHKL